MPESLERRSRHDFCYLDDRAWQFHAWRSCWRSVHGCSGNKEGEMSQLSIALIAWGALFFGLFGLLGWLMRK